MQKYLTFDANCSVCSQLAKFVEERSNELQVIRLSSNEAKELLDRAYPEGWKPAPYLVFERDEKVETFTGFASAVRLAQILGVKNAWGLWNLARKKRAFAPKPNETTASPARRQLLKIGMTLPLIGLAVRAGFNPSTAYACNPCFDCGTNSRLENCRRRFKCGNPIVWDGEYDLNVYDNQSGELCHSFLYTRCDKGC